LVKSVATGGKRKIGGIISGGRHKAPSPFGKLARRARRIAPALAVLGLAAAPHGLFSPASATGAQLTAAQLTAGRVWSGLNTGPPPSAASRYWSRHPSIITLAALRPYAPARAAGPARRSHQRVRIARHAKAAAVRPAVACTGTGAGGMLPANYATIVSFLVAHGYTGNAAAGIVGNIYQESGGNPESVGTGGGGLIGWTPLPAGYVTGNPAADLQTQLSAILAFNQIWAQYIPALNAAATPAQAADIYVTDFERAGIPAAGNREAAAAAVAAACGL
jgi:hypothetical protein